MSESVGVPAAAELADGESRGRASEREAGMAFACCLDEEAKAQLRVSRAIERELESWKKESSREFKLLLLGR